MVQRALRVSQGDDRDKLMSAITSRLPEITDRKIRSKWEQIIKDAAAGILTYEPDLERSNSNETNPIKGQQKA